MVDNLKAFLGLCIVVGTVGLPLTFILGKFNLINKELYRKIKFICKMAFIIGWGSAVTWAIIESFVENF